MSKKYCISCGTLHEFTLEAPRFCSSCGMAFGGASVVKQASAAIAPVKSNKNIETVDNAEEDADREVPQITKLEIEIEVDSSPKVTFGNAKNARSFARDKQTNPLTENDLTTRLDSLFERDRQDQKENK